MLCRTWADVYKLQVIIIVILHFPNCSLALHISSFKKSMQGMTEGIRERICEMITSLWQILSCTIYSWFFWNYKLLTAKYVNLFIYSNIIDQFFIVSTPIPEQTVKKNDWWSCNCLCLIFCSGLNEPLQVICVKFKIYAHQDKWKNRRRSWLAIWIACFCVLRLLWPMNHEVTLNPSWVTKLQDFQSLAKVYHKQNQLKYNACVILYSKTTGCSTAAMMLYKI